MQIILTENIAGCGVKGAIKSVAPGYAQFLLKNGKAKLGTSKAKAEVEKVTKKHEQSAAQLDEDIKAAVAKLKENKLVIKAKANEKGHLFEGIGTDKVAEALKVQAKIDVSESMLELEHPIKEVGEHEIVIVNDSFKGTITVVVEAE